MLKVSVLKHVVFINAQFKSQPLMQSDCGAHAYPKLVGVQTLGLCKAPRNYFDYNRHCIYKD